MRRILFYTIFFMILIIGMAMYFYGPQLPIATGYVARMTCTCTFVEDREKNEIADHNFFYSVLGLVKTKIDPKTQVVSASIFGLAKQVASYRKGIGCILLDGEDDHHISFPASNPIIATKQFWPRDSAVQLGNVNIDKINKAVDKVFDLGPNLEKRTASVLVIYKDSIIAEKYKSPFHKDMPQLGWSMTKSWMNTFIGLMVEDSLFSLNDNNLYKGWTDQRKNISIRHLLNMNSGLEWEENYKKVSDATLMLYDAEDVSEIAFTKPLNYNIGTHWNYSSATTNILSKLAQHKLGSEDNYLTYLHNKFFRPLGMSSAFVETDESGTMIMSSYGYATARDWAKFGLLYLHDGFYGQERILPKGWVEFTKSAATGSNGDYGAHFWLNQGNEYPDAPKDMYYADGYLGQFVYILPSHDLVIVRLGGDVKYFDGNDLIKEILLSLPKTND